VGSSGPSNFSLLTHSKSNSPILQFHVIADSLTTTDLHKFYTKDSALQYANQELLVGLESIVKVAPPSHSLKIGQLIETNQFFDGVFPLLESMKHEIVSLGTSLPSRLYQSRSPKLTNLRPHRNQDLSSLHHLLCREKRPGEQADQDPGNGCVSFGG
jgi:hypothetical protein